MSFNSQAVLIDDQPINASLLGESRHMTSWVTPNNLEVQHAYAKITEGISDQASRLVALWEYVRDIKYVPYVSSIVRINGREHIQEDVWLDPAQSLMTDKLNCFNKSALLASLLRQEYPAEEVWMCLNNVTYDGIGGHAIVYMPGGDFVFETTNPQIQTPWMRASEIDIYEPVMFFNDKVVKKVPEVNLKEPLGTCCVKWLEEYTNDHLCTSYQGPE